MLGLLLEKLLKNTLMHLTVVNTGTTEIQNYIKVSNQKTLVPKDKRIFACKKVYF